MLQFKVRSQRQPALASQTPVITPQPDADSVHPEETCTGLWAEGPGGVKEVKYAPRICLASSCT